jgi:hypothetical protein
MRIQEPILIQIIFTILMDRSVTQCGDFETAMNQFYLQNTSVSSLL